MYVLKLSHHSTTKDLSETQKTAFKLCYPPVTEEFPLLHFTAVVTVTTVASTCPGQICATMFLVN